MKAAIEEFIDVFEENICDPSVDFHRCFNNYTDFLIEIQKEDLEKHNRYQKKTLLKLALWAGEMLSMKYIDPKNVGTSFVIWKKNRSRGNIL